ncbi:hypothetical protein AVEN_135640-1, partial [Araneus ventricosus]
CNRDRGVHRRVDRGKQRTGVRYVRLKGSSILPDPSNGTNGSQRWNMEIIGVSGLRTQAGKETSKRCSVPMSVFESFA